MSMLLNKGGRSSVGLEVDVGHDELFVAVRRGPRQHRVSVSSVAVVMKKGGGM